MTSSYTNLGIELMVTGANAGTWGTKTNTNLEIVEQIQGYVNKSIAGGAQTTTLAIADGSTASSDARNLIIELSGTITGNQVVTVPDSIEKSYIVFNNTSGAFTVEFKTVSGTGVTWTTTDKGKKMVYSDGTNVVDAAFTEVSSDISPQLSGDLNLNSNDITGTGNYKYYRKHRHYRKHRNYWKDGIKAVKYDRLTCLLIEAVKVLSDKVEKLNKEKK
jgi:hypothetical protein